MQQPRFALLAALVCITLLSSHILCEEASKPGLTGRLESIEGMRVLRLWGTPRERGFAHGWLLAKELADGMEQGFTAFLRGNKERYENMVLPLVRRAFVFDKDELAELEGLVEGLRKRLPDRKIRFLERAPSLDDLKVLNTFGDWYALGCSSAALWGRRTSDGKAVAVRNFDFMKMDICFQGQHVRVVAPREGARGLGRRLLSGQHRNGHRNE